MGTRVSLLQQIRNDGAHVIQISQYAVIFLYAAIRLLYMNRNLPISAFFFIHILSIHSRPKVERENEGIVGGLRPDQEWDPSLFLTHTSTLQVQ